MRTLKWSSCNTKYATVNSKGKVVAKKVGKGKKVKITAQALDGTGKKASVTIKKGDGDFLEKPRPLF